MTWIVRHHDGSVEQVGALPGTAGIVTGASWAKLPREIDFVHESYDWSARKIVPRIDVWRAELLAKIDREREDARRPAMTQLLGQSFVYAEKAREVADYRAALGAPIASLKPAQLQARFPFAMAEVGASGDTLAVVIARFEAGATANRQVIARADAKATTAKRLIRSATTLDAMKAAAAVDWEN